MEKVYGKLRGYGKVLRVQFHLHFSEEEDFITRLKLKPARPNPSRRIEKPKPVVEIEAHRAPGVYLRHFSRYGAARRTPRTISMAFCETAHQHCGVRSP